MSRRDFGSWLATMDDFRTHTPNALRLTITTLRSQKQMKTTLAADATQDPSENNG
jgi:hypothetical protein